MIRTQVYFTKEDAQLIEALAAQEGVKKAEMLRTVVKKGLSTILKQRQKSLAETFRALRAIKGMGPKELSKNMDEYLYGKKSKFASSKNPR